MLQELQHALCVSRFAANCRQKQWCVTSAALSVQWRPRCKEQADAGVVTSAAKWSRVEQIREPGHSCSTPQGCCAKRVATRWLQGGCTPRGRMKSSEAGAPIRGTLLEQSLQLGGTTSKGSVVDAMRLGHVLSVSRATSRKFPIHDFLMRFPSDFRKSD